MSKFGYSVKYSQPRRVKHPVLSETLRQKLYYMKNWDILFVHAPVGYGKTSSVQIALNELKCTSAWFFADEYDDSPDEFCMGFLTSLTNSLSKPDYGEKQNYIRNYKTILTAERSPVAALLKVLGQISSSTFPDAIVIDGVHSLTSRVVMEVLLAIRRRLPSDTALILISRSSPPMLLTELFINQKITCITAEDLRFDTKGTELYLKNNGTILSQGSLRYVARLTGGWQLALNAVIHELNSRGGFLEDNSAGTLYCMAEYIKGAILGVFDKPIIDKIVLTSFLPSFTTDFCKQALCFKNCEEVLSTLERDTGLIYSPSPGVFKYHPLFRLFLKNFYEDLPPDRKGDYRLDDIIGWLSANGRLFDALHIAARFNLPEHFAPILHRIFTKEADGGTENMLRLVSILPLMKIPEQVLYNDYGLCAVCACAAYVSGDLSSARLFLSYLKASTGTEYTWVRALIPESSVLDKLNFLNTFTDSHNSHIGLLTYRIQAFLLETHLPFFHRPLFNIMETIAVSSEGNSGSCTNDLSPLFACPEYELYAAGLHFERNELEQALNLLHRQNSAESIYLRYCRGVLTIETLFAQNKKESAFAKLDELRSIVSGHSRNLQRNLYAYGINRSLHNSDSGAAVEWLTRRKTSVNDCCKPWMYFENTVTAKALIVSGEIEKATSMLEELIRLCESYKQWIDLTEALAILAVCCAKSANYQKAGLYMEKALLIAAEYNIITPIVSLGTDVVYLLKKALAKKKRNPCVKTMPSSLSAGLSYFPRKKNKRAGYFVITPRAKSGCRRGSPKF